MRSNRKAIKKELILISGKYLYDFCIELTYKEGSKHYTIIKDFTSLFNRYAKGDYIKYLSVSNFKKFKVHNGNIIWGRNEDIIFKGQSLLKTEKGNSQTEEILYII